MNLVYYWSFSDSKINSPCKRGLIFLLYRVLFSPLTVDPARAGTVDRLAFRVRLYLPPDSSETESLARPFARRLASTLRPLAVCMRLRNP
jgi:hypothetical protein